MGIDRTFADYTAESRMFRNAKRFQELLGDRTVTVKCSDFDDVGELYYSDVTTIDPVSSPMVALATDYETMIAHLGSNLGRLRHSKQFFDKSSGFNRVCISTGKKDVLAYNVPSSAVKPIMNEAKVYKSALGRMSELFGATDLVLKDGSILGYCAVYDEHEDIQGQMQSYIAPMLCLRKALSGYVELGSLSSAVSIYDSCSINLSRFEDLADLLFVDVVGRFSDTFLSNHDLLFLNVVDVMDLSRSGLPRKLQRKPVNMAWLDDILDKLHSTSENVEPV